MAELHAQRIPIPGEAGVGYVLDHGYDMPPLMLTADELEAAVLGAAWVASEADPSLARAARDLVSKLSSAIQKSSAPLFWTEVRNLFRPAPLCPNSSTARFCATPFENAIACN
jgi:predicted DNA-binding transcriptional regulator YafY